MIILGIDPGLDRMGYAVLESTPPSAIRPLSYGLIHSSKDLPQTERLRQIAQDIRHLLHSYHPQALSIETLFFGKNVSNALHVSEARGVVMLLCAEAGMDIIEVPPSYVKKTLTRNGKAQKAQVQETIRLLLGLPELPQPDDVADALAIAMVGLR